MTEFEEYWKNRYASTYTSDNEYVDNTMPVKVFKEYIQDAFEAGQEPKENNWIKCSDRLPTEKDCNVYGIQVQFDHVLIAICVYAICNIILLLLI